MLFTSSSVEFRSIFNQILFGKSENETSTERESKLFLVKKLKNWLCGVGLIWFPGAG